MPEPRLGYSEQNGIVTVRMTRDDWGFVVWNLGRIAGIDHVSEGRGALIRHLALLNRLEVGNPNYTPYEIPENEFNAGGGNP